MKRKSRLPRSNLTRQKVELILRNAKAKHLPIILGGRLFIGADLSDLDLVGKYAIDGNHSSDYLGADFRHAKLQRCRFQKADIGCANLRGCDLTQSNLIEANLYNALFEGANLKSADLRGANLISAELHEVILTDANFAGVTLGRTSIAGVDLSTVKGLDEVIHVDPSPIGSDTLRMTANGLDTQPEFQRLAVLKFLSAAGIDDDILTVFKSWVGSPIEIYSVFLSHSSIDKEFARKLYWDLQNLGIRCWFDEKQVLPGDKILFKVDQGIKLWDKFVLVCSKNSLSPKTGWWVEQELERILAKERHIQKESGKEPNLLIPITIDSYVFKRWHSQYRETVLQRHVGDFSNWKDPEKYANSLSRLRDAIKAANDVGKQA